MHRKGGVHHKGRAHGLGPWQGTASPKLNRPPSSQDGGLALQRLVVSPTVTSSFGAARQTVSLAPKWQSLLLLCLALLC